MNSSLMRAAIVLLLAGSAVMMGCAGGDDDADLDADTLMTDTTGFGDEMEERAVVELEPTEGHAVVGTATFISENGSVRIEATVSGLAPGMHGIHVHENGDCSAPDASSAGGHFNPDSSSHGGPDAAQRHVGDLGNLEAGQDSTAQYTRVDDVISLSGPNSIVGKALVIHSGEDDLTSQPSGDAGERVACGVIEMENGMGTMPGGVGTGTTADTANAL